MGLYYSRSNKFKGKMQIPRSILLVCSLLVVVLANLTVGDVIMMNGNGMPSIIENDDFGQDVILMPGMSNMVINEDLVL